MQATVARKAARKGRTRVAGDAQAEGEGARVGGHLEHQLRREAVCWAAH